MTDDVRNIALDRIDVGRRLRAYREGAVAELAGSIQDAGLIHPITVYETDDGYRLIAGLHRLEACRRLGWAEIPASVRVADELGAELMEIDENLRRTELTVLERGEHLVRRSEILKAQGRRAHRGRPRKGATETPFPETTAALAEAAKIGERTAQRYMQVAGSLPSEVRDLLRPTPYADSTSTLLDLAKIKRPEDQVEVTRLLTSGEVDSLYQAKAAVEQRYHTCRECGEVLDKYLFSHRQPVHCKQCGHHFFTDFFEDRRACTHCGTFPPFPRGYQSLVQPSPPIGGGDIVGALPEPFFRKGGHKPGGVMLPMPDEEGAAAVKPSDLAYRFADAVDSIKALDAASLTKEAERVAMVRASIKELRRWVEQLGTGDAAASA